MSRFTNSLVALAATGVLCGCQVASADTPENITKSTTRAQDCSNLVGAWTNQLGSRMEITSQDAQTGRLSGRYRSGSGTTGNFYPLIGWVNEAATSEGDHVVVVSFTVRWGEYGSIASWTGVCRDRAGTHTLEMMWHLARSNSDYEWDHIWANKDFFTPAN